MLKTVSYSVKLVFVESTEQEEQIRAQGLRDSVFRACDFFEHFQNFANGLEFVLAD